MVSRAADSSSKPKKTLKDLMELGWGNLILKIKQLKEEIEAGRALQIKDKLYKNQKKLQSHIRGILSAPLDVNISSIGNSCEAPRLGIESLCILNGFVPGSADKDLASIHEVIFAKSKKLPEIQRIPRYTTWIFLDRNQRMAEDQSVVGRRRIYYDQSGNEALICSESEEDLAEIEEEKREFSEGEDRILWMVFKEHGLDADVAEVVCHFIGGNPVEIQERFNELKLKSQMSQVQASSGRNLLLEKSLSTALDSFDNLFCRRCLVFDCRLHGCAQNLVYPCEKPLSSSEPEVKKPCSDQCYLLVRQTTLGLVTQTSSLLCINGNLESAGGEGASGALSTSTVLPVGQPAHLAKRNITNENDCQVSESFGSCVDTKLKKIRALEHPDHTTSNPIQSQMTSGCQANDVIQIEVNYINRTHEFGQATSSLVERRKTLFSNYEWRPLEKDLYLKGLEIFGRNSCLIARNLLSGLKTCSEVSAYMRNDRSSMTHDMDIARSLEENARANSGNLELLVRSRSKLVRKRGRTRRLKYSLKSNGLPSSWKRMGDGELLYKQYTPCACEFMCGKDCPCQKNGTCCEKYCGCSKNCKNKFRGCHCAKSQCRSRQCPCFAANRECDPDVCRNCWVSCGGDSLGVPPKRGEGQCGNMRLLLRQQQRILLGRSDVAGWGAFIKNSVNKNDYLGEYTGEVIPENEANKRGKIYDRANSSFLFDLNDQYVLDACRQGDKLKFANHSPKPNCYCRVLLVAGDHRVGIFAKEHIEAMQELFYDYRYGINEEPAWSRALRSESSKRNDLQPSQGRPRKHQSR